MRLEIAGAPVSLLCRPTTTRDPACRGARSSVISSLKRGRADVPASSHFWTSRAGALAAMLCRYCHDWAGLVRRTCAPCGRALAIVETAAGRVGWTELVDMFADAGLTRERVDLVLDAELDGKPTLRDRLTSRMTNALMQNLGMPGRQSPEDVRRVRLEMESGGEGTWASGEKPPETP